MIYVYAIGEEAATVDEAGLDDRPVEAVRHGSLTAFVSRGVRSAVAASPATLRRHDRVVAAAMDAGTVLPMRFGTLVGGDRDLAAVLSERGQELERTLDRVRGRVEVGVRAEWSGDEPAPRDGRDFMLAKLERRRAARRLADAIHPPLAGLAADSRCTLLPRDDTAFACAYLVDRGREGELARRAAKSGAAHEDVDLVVTGPWPPYSFSEARDG